MVTFIFVILFILYLLFSLALIFFVLMQSGKGGGLSGLVGASTFGDNIGATGAERTLTRWTTICAVGFLVLNILLVILGAKAFQRDRGIIQEMQSEAPVPVAGQTTTGTAPAQPAQKAPVPAR